MTDSPEAPGVGLPAAIDEEIATLARLISQARELVAAGHTIDLNGLTEKVAVFCASLADNPPEDTESVTQMIEALVTDLNMLAQEMTDQHAQATSGDNGGGN